MEVDNGAGSGFLHDPLCQGCTIVAVGVIGRPLAVPHQGDSLVPAGLQDQMVFEPLRRAKDLRTLSNDGLDRPLRSLDLLQDRSTPEESFEGHVGRMAPGVIADEMPFFMNPADEIRAGRCLPSYDEKGRLCTVIPQSIQDPW